MAITTGQPPSINTHDTLFWYAQDGRVSIFFARESARQCGEAIKHSADLHHRRSQEDWRKADGLNAGVMLSLVGATVSLVVTFALDFHPIPTATVAFFLATAIAFSAFLGHRESRMRTLDRLESASEDALASSAGAHLWMRARTESQDPPVSVDDWGFGAHIVISPREHRLPRNLARALDRVTGEVRDDFIGLLEQGRSGEVVTAINALADEERRNML